MEILQDTIEIDEDLLTNSARSLETLVSVGMTLGVSKKKYSEVGLPNLEKCVLRAWEGYFHEHRKFGRIVSPKFGVNPTLRKLEQLTGKYISVLMSICIDVQWSQCQKLFIDICLEMETYRVVVIFGMLDDYLVINCNYVHLSSS